MATKLELANHMLATVGERAQVSVDTGHPSMIQAISILDSCNADFQARGWWFNTEKAITLVQNTAGEIILPASTTEFTAGGTRLVQRGNRVYDNESHSFIFTAPIIANLTLLLPIEDMPAPAANYLKHKAAQDMYEDDDGDEQKATRLERRKMEAWGALQTAQLKAAPVNAFSGRNHLELRYRMGGGTTGNPDLIGGGRYR